MVVLLEEVPAPRAPETSNPALDYLMTTLFQLLVMLLVAAAIAYSR